MNRVFNIIKYTFLVVALTITTQVGGICLLIALLINLLLKFKNRAQKIVLFLFTYFLISFLLIPKIAPIWGREKVSSAHQVTATSWFTTLLNRNYVTPQLNQTLQKAALQLKKHNIQINYLDANFPFVNGFPLLPHLSHNDGKKIDLSFIYENADGTISPLKKSMSGYGVFESPTTTEFNQIEWCVNRGYFQYDFPKYLTFGTIHKNLIFSPSANKTLIEQILTFPEVDKVFIEPHLKHRLNLTHSKIKYHGCRAVRHDDHIHLQIK